MFAVLVVMSLGWLRPDGFGNFDGRVLGYSPDEARAYLAVLPDAARELYLGAFRVLDTIFPVVAALAIGGATWRMAKKQPLIRRCGMMGMVGAYLVMDLAENAFVAQMLRSDGQVAADLVERASDMTQLKWLFLGLSLMMLAGAWWRDRRLTI